MLAELFIRQFVLFEDAHLSFSEGLTVISGETGAGKSLLATALSTVLAQTRFSTDSIREGADAATLTAVFHLSPQHIAELRSRLDVELPDAESEGILIERTIARSGRSRSAICGVTVPGSTVRALGGELADLFAQNEHMRIREPGYQCDLLDAYGALEPMVSKVATVYGQARELLDRLEGGDAERLRREQEAARIRFHVDEINAFAPDPDTDAQLDELIGALEHADAIRAFCDHGVQALYEDDQAVCSLLGTLSVESSRVAPWSALVTRAGEGLEQAIAALDDVVHDLRAAADAVDGDPADLDRLNERRHALRELCRKHGCESHELPLVCERLSNRLAEIEGMTMDVAELEAAFAEKAQAFLSQAHALREARTTAAAKLAKSLRKHLKLLGMEHAEFMAVVESLEPKDADARAAVHAGGHRGLDTISFRLRPNPGEAWSLVSETTSGGETSRTLLAICTVLASAHRCGTLFFDEIDAGVGGRLGDPIGRHMHELARNRQVIAITHLPQVACYGQSHLCVRKRVSGGRTRTDVVPVLGDDRISEVASMIRGDESRQTTMQLAREMLGERS